MTALTIHAVHIISEFLEASGDTVFARPDARWRAFVQFQLELTPSQRMALLDLIAEHLRRPDAIEQFIDCSNDNVTTPGDLLQMVTNAQFQTLKGET
jgi:hypothetical protein